MGQSMAEKPPRVRNRKHQEMWEVLVEELEEVPVEELEEVARKALEEELQEAPVAVERAPEAAEEVPVAAVVAATTAEVGEALQETLLRTLQKTPIKARNVAVMMTMEMMTPRTIQVRSSSRILHRERVHTRRRANRVVARLAEVANSPE